MALEVYPRIDDVHLPSRQAEVARHELCVVLARGEIAIDPFAVRSDQLDRTTPIVLRQGFEKDVVSLEGRQDRAAPVALQFRNQAREKHVGQDHDVGTEIGCEPSDYLAVLFLLHAGAALEHRDRQIAKLLGLDADPEPRYPTEKSGEVEEAIKEPRGVPEQPASLLQVDVDPSEEHSPPR